MPLRRGEPNRREIALIRRGTCTFQTKAANAQAAGAPAGIVIYNNQKPASPSMPSGEVSQCSPSR